MSDIFISYAREDRSRVDAIAKALLSRGWVVWWDPKIRPGQSWDQVIEQALDETRCVVVVWSKTSVSKRWVRDEAREGKQRNILVPVLIDHINEFRIPLEFRHVEYADLSAWGGAEDDSEFQSLLDAISTLVPLPKSIEAPRPDSSRTNVVESEVSITHLQEALPGGTQSSEERTEAGSSVSASLTTEQDRPVSDLRGQGIEGSAESQEFEPEDGQDSAVEGVDVPQSSYSHPGQTESGSAVMPGTAYRNPWKSIQLGGLGLVTLILGIAAYQWWEHSKPLSEPQKAPVVQGGSHGETSLEKSEQETYKPTPRKDGASMVRIPAGEFMMGSPDGQGYKDERPVHEVRFPKPFAMAQYETTFEEYDGFAQATGRTLPDDAGFGRGRRPVINVSWKDAKDYAQWLSQQTGKRYRLPTESEWEYAAGAGGTDEWFGTSAQEQLRAYAVYAANSQSRTAPVGSKKPNRLGLHDMSGNVWEWVEDCWHVNYKKAPKDGSAWGAAGGDDCGRRVLRGGSYFNSPENLRASFRLWRYADDRISDVGFRLAQDIE